MPSKRKNEEEHAARSVTAAGDSPEERVTLMRENFIAKLSKEAVALHAELEKRQATLLKHLQLKVDDHVQDVQDLENEIERLEKKIKALKAGIELLKKKIKDLEDEIKPIAKCNARTAAAQAITYIQEKQYEDIVEVHEAALRQEKEKVRRLLADNKALKAKNLELEAEVEKWESDHGQCEKDFVEAEQEIAELEAEAEKYKGAYEEVTDVNAALEKEVKYLKDQLQEEKAEVAHFQEKYEDAKKLLGEAQDIANEADAVAVESKERAEKCQAYIDAFNNLSVHFAAERTKVTELEGKIAYAETIYAQSQAALNEEQSKAARLEDEAKEIISAKDQAILGEQIKVVSQSVQIQQLTTALATAEKKNSELTITLAAAAKESSEKTTSETQVTGLQATLTHVQAEATQLRTDLAKAQHENAGLSGQLASSQQTAAAQEQQSTGLVAAEARIVELETLLAASAVPLPAAPKKKTKAKKTVPSPAPVDTKPLQERIVTLETLLAASLVPLPSAPKKKKAPVDFYKKTPKERVVVLETVLAASLVPLPVEPEKTKKTKKGKKAVRAASISLGLDLLFTPSASVSTAASSPPPCIPRPDGLSYYDTYWEEDGEGGWIA